MRPAKARLPLVVLLAVTAPFLIGTQGAIVGLSIAVFFWTVEGIRCRQARR